MEKSQRKKHLILLMVGLLTVFIGIFLYTIFANTNCCMCGDSNNECCPCPNKELVPIVENYTGQQASSAGSWKYLCTEYKEATKDKRECFE